MSAATEADYTNTVIEAAKLGGYLVVHFRAGRTVHGWVNPIQGDKGFPDVIALHPVLCIGKAFELKCHPRKPTPEQLSWLLAFQLVGFDARLVYVPDELDALVAELVAPTIRPTPTTKES